MAKPQLLTSVRKLSRRQAATFAGLTAVVSVGVMVAIFAAGTPTAFEPESGTLTSPAAVVTPAGASGSGAVQFKAASTPTPTPAACTGSANTPGGPDPWGGCWPGPNNTGVPAGTQLTVHSGDLTIAQSNYTLQNTEVDGCLTLNSGLTNITIKNVRVKGACIWPIRNNGATGVTIQDTEIDGLNNTANNDAGAAGDNMTFLRVSIYGVYDGMKAGDNETVQDCYIHDLLTTSTSHSDGIQTLGTTSLTIRHNTILQNGDGTSIILSTGSATDMRNVLMDKNLFGGGGFTVYGGYSAGRDDISKVSNIQITNNRFTTVYYPKSGYYGPLTSDDPPVVHTGNLWADGPNAGQDLD